MAIWLTALKVIPWAEVIAATPAVTQAARKLFKRTREAPLADVIVASGADPAAVLSVANIQALEATVAQLRTQQQATAAVMESLAAQNSQIVNAIDILRMRQRLLIGLCGALCAVVVGLTAWLISR